VWAAFGYQGGYLDRFSAPDVQFERNYGSRDSLFDSHVQCLKIIENRVYIGGYESFGYIVPGTGERRFFYADDKMSYFDVCAIETRTDDPLLYLGALFGIVSFNPQDESFSVLRGTDQKRVTALAPDSAGIWYGTLSGGLWRYDFGTDTAVVTTITAASRIEAVWPMVDNGTLHIFCATKHDGILRYSPKKKSVERIFWPGSVLSGDPATFGNAIMTAAVIDNRLWLGTRRHGCLIYFPQRGRWARFDYYNGLVSDQVRAFSSDMNHLWIGCYGGLNKIEKNYLDDILEP
jgi:ligand-binding sensor domain-containing protein